MVEQYIYVVNNQITVNIPKKKKKNTLAKTITALLEKDLGDHFSDKKEHISGCKARLLQLHERLSHKVLENFTG